MGPTAWKEVDQQRIDAFAAVTDDHQWIHTDPERTGASPFGSTIAHGFLTLSLGPAFMEELIRFDGFVHSLNYGLQKVRFPAPLPVESRICMNLELLAVEAVGEGAQLTARRTFERDGSDKPVCAAESLARLVEGSS